MPRWTLAKIRLLSRRPCSVAYPDPYLCFGPPGSESVSTRYGSRSYYHQAKIVRKTLIPIVLRLLFDFLSLKNDAKTEKNHF
jgi:hypothetical protein